MSHKERVKRYRTEGGAADLVRVEVLVPDRERDEILRLAARMRADYRNEKAHAELEDLRRQAVEQYGTQCLWNIKAVPTPSGMKAVADNLRKYGDMNAWRLASKIREKLGHAS